MEQKLKTQTINLVKKANLLTTIGFIAISLLLPLTLSAQPFSLPDGDEDMMPPPQEEAMREGRRGQRKGQMQNLANFSWETAEKNLLPLIKKENAPLYQFIVSAKDKKSPTTKRIMRALAIMENGRDHHPDNFKVMFRMGIDELETERLAMLYQQEHSEPKKNEIKNQIRAKLKSAFEQKENLRMIIIDRLQNNINKQKEEHQKRLNKKDRIIDKRLKMMLEDTDDAEW